MATQEVIKLAVEKMEKVHEHMRSDFSTMRAGTANPAILERVTVDYYGSQSPINQLANVSVGDARTILIQPWDKSMLPVIEKAILASDLGITPNSDGTLIRLTVPQLTEETRKELVKNIKKRAEEAKVAVRNVRRDANDKIKDIEKQKLAAEDACKDALDVVQKETDKAIKNIDAACAAKEKEVMSV